MGDVYLWEPVRLKAEGIPLLLLLCHCCNIFQIEKLEQRLSEGQVLLREEREKIGQKSQLLSELSELQQPLASQQPQG